MRKNTLALFTVIYPQVDIFLADLFHSINCQKVKNFDFFIYNDEYPKIQFIRKEPNISLIENINKLKPVLIRKHSIDEIINRKYKKLIFIDADDFMSLNRIDVIAKCLNNFDFAYNEFDLISKNGKLFKRKILTTYDVPSIVKSYKSVLDRNFLGMSNTAINLKALKDFPIPNDIVVFDWWLYTIMILRGCIGKFVPNVITYYRQTNRNTIGIEKRLTIRRLDVGLNTKLIHYKNIISFCKSEGYNFAIDDYVKRFEQMKELHFAIKNKIFKNAYIYIVNKYYGKIFNGWWSEILPLDQWRKYGE